MYRIVCAILIPCIHNANGVDKEIFDRNVDDIFKSIIGDPDEIKAQMIERGRTYKWYKHTLPPNIGNNTWFNDTHIVHIITTTQKIIPLTTPKEIDANTTLEYHKFRLKKLEITQLLKDNISPLPNFAKDQDNPDHITRRFDKLVAESENNKPYRREVYHDYVLKNQEHVRIFGMKMKIKNLMLHFIYATRYKLPYMQLLRKKYKELLKYQIGYCFALLRYLKQLQKNLYSALMANYKVINNLLFHLKIYEKIVRLDVDIRDVCKLIKVLNYKRNLEDNPKFYDDSDGEKSLPPSSLGGPPKPGVDDPGPPPPLYGATEATPAAPVPEGLFPGRRRAIRANIHKATTLSRWAFRADLPKGTIMSQKALKADAPKANIISRRAMRGNTHDSFVRRNMQRQGPSMVADQRPYGTPAPERKKSMSTITPQLPPLLKNGRRLYAPLPDGMKL